MESEVAVRETRRRERESCLRTFGSAFALRTGSVLCCANLPSLPCRDIICVEFACKSNSHASRIRMQVEFACKSNSHARARSEIDSESVHVTQVVLQGPNE